MARYPLNKFERRKIGLNRDASRGFSRLTAPQGSLPLSIRPRVFRNSPKTAMHSVRKPYSSSSPQESSGREPDLGLIARLEELKAKYRFGFNRRPELVTVLKAEKQKSMDLNQADQMHPEEIFNTRRKITYKGKKWELMKKENRKTRAKTIVGAHSQEIEGDPRLKNNKNAILSILSFERVSVKPNQKLFDSLMTKFQEEGNTEAAIALRLGRKLVFDEGMKKWVDSVVRGVNRRKAESEARQK